MWPWTHLAFGYLVVSLTWRLGRHRVDGAVAAATVLGTQFPDLVDKPLAWYVGVLPAGRSLAHSVVTATTVSVVVLTAVALRDRSGPGLAFVVAYWSHLLGDALPRLLAGEYELLAFLLWPLRSVPDNKGGSAVLDDLAEVLTAPSAYLLDSPLRLSILAAVVLVWLADGVPGLAGVGRYLSNTLRARSD